MSTRGSEKAGGVAHLNSGDRGDLSDSLLPFEEPPLRGSSQTLGEGPACTTQAIIAKRLAVLTPTPLPGVGGPPTQSMEGAVCLERQLSHWPCTLPPQPVPEDESCGPAHCRSGYPGALLMPLRTWGPTSGTLLSSPGVPHASSPPRTSSQVDSRLQDLGLNQHHLEPITPPWV